MKKALAKIGMTIAMFAMLIAPSAAMAQGSSQAVKNEANQLLWGGTEKVVAGKIGLGEQDLRVTIASIINVALSLLGIVAVVIILMGGFQWMTAGGDQGKVDSARKLIFSGIVGLAIILSAYAIASFVINSLVSATTGIQ